MGTTDLHGNIFNRDHYKDAEFDHAAHDDVGLAKVATLVDALRTQRVRENTLLIDAGDTIHGTPLAYCSTKVQPISRTVIHPMAAATNEMGYHAAALGNPEFNYGIPRLRLGNVTVRTRPSHNMSPERMEFVRLRISAVRNGHRPLFSVAHAGRSGPFTTAPAR